MWWVFLLFHYVSHIYFCRLNHPWILSRSNVFPLDVRNQLACISLLNHTEWFLGSPVHPVTFEDEMHRRRPYLQQIAQSTRHLLGCTKRGNDPFREKWSQSHPIHWQIRSEQPAFGKEDCRVGILANALQRLVNLAKKKGDMEHWKQKVDNLKQTSWQFTRCYL